MPNGKRKAVSWMKEYWNQFQAVEKYFNDASESCGAKLHYKDEGDQPGMIVGATGKGGHAEMNALTQFLKHKCNYDKKSLEKFQERGLKIECPAKPCCVRCSIILGSLGFTAVGGDYDKVEYEMVEKVVRGKVVLRPNKKNKISVTTCHGDTYKTEKSMGSTEWALAPDVRTFLAGFLGLREKDILDISSLAGY